MKLIYYLNHIIIANHASLSGSIKSIILSTLHFMLITFITRGPTSVALNPNLTYQVLYKLCLGTIPRKENFYYSELNFLAFSRTKIPFKKHSFEGLFGIFLFEREFEFSRILGDFPFLKMF